MPATRAGEFTLYREPPMRENMKLDVANLVVESFTTVLIPPKPENLLTCMDTNCGNKLCCA
jgi:hypothetical protein